MTTNVAARYGFDPYLDWIAKEGVDRKSVV